MICAAIVSSSAGATRSVLMIVSFNSLRPKSCFTSRAALCPWGRPHSRTAPVHGLWRPGSALRASATATAALCWPAISPRFLISPNIVCSMLHYGFTRPDCSARLLVRLIHKAGYFEPERSRGDLGSDRCPEGSVWCGRSSHCTARCGLHLAKPLKTWALTELTAVNFAPAPT